MLILETTIASSPLLENTLIAEEIEIEMEASRAGVKRYNDLKNKTIARGDGASLKPIQRMTLHWYDKMRAAVRAEQRAVRLSPVGSEKHADLLLAIDSERAAVIAMHATLSACLQEIDGVVRTSLYYTIGSTIAAEVNMDKLRDSETGDIKKLERSARKMTPQRVNAWARKRLGDEAELSRIAAASLGSCMYWLLIGVASVTDYDKPFVPAFQQVSAKRVKGKKPTFFVKLHDDVLAMIDEGHAAREIMRPRLLPMVCEPLPWKSKDNIQGGYIRLRSPAISKPTTEQMDAMRAAGANMDHGYKALNALSSTPWRINRAILEVQRAVWENGGGDAGIPATDDNPKPPMPADFETNEVARKEWKREAVRIYRENIVRRSDRENWLHKSSIADRFSNHEAIYFPHVWDFRYRGYPAPLHLHHQGDDVCRGLLEFSEGRDVEVPVEGGKEGAISSYNWIRIHLANCYGFDKHSIQDRIQWSRSCEEKIVSAAEAPLDNIEFWSQADKPWQFLAACMAHNNTSAARHLPIQVDGTCNGLQHYAAMGRDEAGARLVNLVPGDAPNDPYTNVALAAHAIASADADAGHPIAQRIVDHVGRGLCKQPVMTTVYGVTAVGAREQVQARLHELGFKGQEAYDAADYVAKIVLSSIGQICSSATKIMAWVQKGAKQIAADGKLVRWTNPLEMPIVQPYRRGKIINVWCKSEQLALQVNGGPVRRARHVSGSAPNFVHSIDAAHMMLTAAACKDAGIAFAAVHDSFWTHAADMDKLSVILREEFVRLHSVDQVDRLYQEWSRNHPNIKFDPPPAKGSFDVSQVLKSTYAFL